MNQEVIEFVQKGICNLDRDERKEAYENFIQALTLLKAEQPLTLNSCPYPPCKGEGKLQQNAGIYYVYCNNCGRHTNSFETDTDAIKAWNNTNKAEQPPAGDFTTKLRFELVYREIAKVNNLFDKAVLKACAIIDRSESSRKELLENLKMLVALLCHSGSFVSAKDIEKAKAAIAREKEGGE